MKAIIIDDEKPVLMIMKRIMSEVPGVEVVGAFQSTSEAYSFIKENKVDIIFSDIKMPDQSGLELARKIIPEHEDIELVFMTSYSDYALEAFDVQASDYILKPVSRERLELTVKKIMKRKNMLSKANGSGNPAKLSIHCLGGMDLLADTGEKIRLSTAKSIELLAYLVFHRGRFVSKWRIMDDLFQELPPYNAETYLNTSTYRLRKALEPYGLKDIVITANESYALNIKDIQIDFIQFEKQVKAFSTINPFNLNAAVETEERYTGELFGDVEYEWSLAERERIFNLYRDFAIKLAETLIKLDELALAAQVLRRLQHKDVLDEEVNCLLMHLFAKKNDKVSLIRQYRKYTKALREELDISPGRNMNFLYESLLKSLQ